MVRTTTDYDVLTTVTYEFDGDDMDPAEVTVRVDGDEPPEELAEAVHGALERTIAHLLDGREVLWRKNEGQRGPEWKFIFRSGIPEMPVGPEAPGEWLPPYRTREKFEGADASGDGLFDNLPGDWHHELERRSVFGFYQL